MNVRVREANGTWGTAEALTDFTSNLSTELMLTANRDNSLSLLWYADGEYRVATLEPGETEWSEWNVADSVPSTAGVGGAWLTSLSDGSSALALVRWDLNTDRSTTLLRRASGSATWTVSHSQDDSGFNTYYPVMSANEAGDLAILTRYSTNGGADRAARVLRYTKSTDSWSSPTEPISPTADVEDMMVTITTDGTVVASWVDHPMGQDGFGQPTGTNAILTSYLSPGESTWSTPEQVTPVSGAGAIIPILTPDNNNHAVLTYQLYTDQGGYMLPTPTARAFDAGTETWGAPEDLYAFGGAPMPSRNSGIQVSRFGP